MSLIRRVVRAGIANPYPPLRSRLGVCELKTVGIQLSLSRCFSRQLCLLKNEREAATGLFISKRARTVCKESMWLPYERELYQIVAMCPHRLLLYRAYSTYRPHHHGKKDLYSILNISPDATQAQIKESYYKMSMKYHPDRNKGSEEAHRRFTQITEAYSVLGQYEKRKKYDKGLLRDYAPPPHHDHHSQQPFSDFQMRKSKDVVYNFDEFYRMHYGDALRREQDSRRVSKYKERFHVEDEYDQEGFFDLRPVKGLILTSFVISSWYLFGRF